MKITIQYFGAFRQFGKEITFNIDESVSSLDVKAMLITHLGDEHKFLVEDSALANDREILDQDAIFSNDMILSILPPVCGG